MTVGKAKARSFGNDLCVLLQSPESDCRQAAVEAIGEMGVPPPKDLLPLLSHEDAAIRTAAIRAMGRCHRTGQTVMAASPEVATCAAACAARLDDDCVWCRWAAAEALSRMGGPSCRPHVETVLQRLAEELVLQKKTGTEYSRHPYELRKRMMQGHVWIRVALLGVLGSLDSLDVTAKSEKILLRVIQVLTDLAERDFNEDVKVAALENAGRLRDALDGTRAKAEVQQPEEQELKHVMQGRCACLTLVQGKDLKR